MSAEAHLPVLLDEVIQWLRPEQGGILVDCTVGMGGHSDAMLAASERVTVIGIDRDAESLSLASKRLEKYGKRFIAVHANYKDIESVLNRISPELGGGSGHSVNRADIVEIEQESAGGFEESGFEGGGTRGLPEVQEGSAAVHGSGVTEVAGILADFGISSYQLDQADRGFSFSEDAPLDMRMDRSLGETAADLVNGLSERELADLIYQYGEERGSRKIARAIVRQREKSKIETTAELAGTVVKALKVRGRWRIHPATRTFQALRIAVNKELEGLAEFISSSISCLQIGGRLAIISFHSLEDRIVKNAFKLEAGHCQCPSGPSRTTDGQFQSGVGLSDVVCYLCGARKRVAILTRKPVRPSDNEIAANPRSRSARLRVVERIGTAQMAFSPV